MASVNDPSGYEEKYRRARERLRDADINDEDRRAIESYIEDLETSGDHEYSSLESYTTVLIRAAKMAHKPLTEWEDKDPEQGVYQSDYSTFMQGLRTGNLDGAKDDGYSDEYRRSFRQNFRPFFRFLGREWADDIDIGQPSKGKVTESDCFTSDETARMFGVADRRDSAMIALWLATGQRASAIASLKLGDVEFGKERGRFLLNPDAIGLKGAEGWRPMLWASPYVKRWVENHPRRGDDAAPLFCAKRNGGSYSIGDPLSYDGIKRVVETVCEQAGIDRDKATTHRFRHTAIRRMIRDGLSEQKIKFMVGWHEDSTQLARYGSLQDTTHMSDVEEAYGWAEGDEDEAPDATLDNCPDCGVPLSELANPSFCPDCGLPLTHSDREVEKAIQQDIGAEKALNPDNEEQLEEIANDDALLAKLIELRRDGEE